MRKLLIIAGVIGLSTALTSTASFADLIPASAVPIDKVVSNLQDQNYKIIKEVEFDDGMYEAKVITSQGREIKLQIDPKSGKIVNIPENMIIAISINEALSNVKKSGYTNIYEIEFERGGYEVKAYSSKNQQKVKLFVDGQSGKITVGW